MIIKVRIEYPIRELRGSDYAVVGSDFVELSLPKLNLEDYIKALAPIEMCKVVSMAPDVRLTGCKFNSDNLDDVRVLNQALLYIQKRYELEDELFDAFIAILEATKYTPLDAFKVLVDEHFEFFPGIKDSEELAQLLVRLDRVFSVKLTKEVRKYLDYKKIGASLEQTVSLSPTSVGMIWFKDSEE